MIQNKFSYQKSQKIKSYNFKSKNNYYSNAKTFNHICSNRTYILARNEFGKLTWKCHICRKFSTQPQEQTDREIERIFSNFVEK